MPGNYLEVADAGLKIAGIESVNIHDDIKIGGGERDKYIENYIKTLERLGQEDIHMVCYNFMPVFDWTRSELARPCPDGSTVLAYNSKAIDGVKPDEMFARMEKNSNGFVLPGWEPERMARVKELFEMYKDVDEEKLFNNLVYFLKAIMPVCDKYNISKRAMYDVVNKYSDEEKALILADSIKDYSSNFTKKANEIIALMLDRIENQVKSDDKIQLSQLVTSLGILYDKLRLNENLSTNNSSININIKIE